MSTEPMDPAAQAQQPQAAPAGPARPLVPAQPSGGSLAVASGLAMKRRNPVGVWLGLPLITLGIYGLVWYYKIHKEMAQFDPRRKVPVAGPMLVLLFLGWTIVAPLISYANAAHRVADAQRAAGLQPTCKAWAAVLLAFVFGLTTLYLQSELNRAVDRYPNTVPGTQVPLFA